jgi:hypothetical protein
MRTEWPSNQSCESCRFFYQFAWAKSTGLCRRYPPQIYYSPAIGESCERQPEREARDWCGEWKANDPPDG